MVDNFNPELQQSDKSSKKKVVSSHLTKDNIIIHVPKIDFRFLSGNKKVNSHYHIGIDTIKKIWALFNPYEHANSIGKLNLPDWHNKSVKIKKVNSHYHIGIDTIKKIWALFNPYEHANSIGKLNLPDWHNKSVKIKKVEISPDPMPQEINI
ncbi:hypothetical protein Glove_83g51 [Diversispora epigaea]|uniref:Uncharacterized protein n=1 Tax=Diversispora epigaea TaxID=1348612 RepID=A0A397JIA5_9GLOM|nr:hypothetical protein Glove_83g51 [Diversispora epigaea]